ncbi:SpoIIE family protein phosphatase [Oscillatoria sp. FACHB-1407]|uniref:SpoIIE family protein phosphatase n=1 Tax=Oscillatoria sp. FACHB-1407 TaxID=2692847 RepID=UPI001683660E|nr:SpoIIE family protein phosphatase [Oscillatoria sp. FACHB-1407]MBD2464292.1 SpoIIE family protein phosphatase [Oscillatoria sp. FACHB-1407]
MTSADNSKLRLMVVDDESDNLDLLYRTFRREFHVFKAESALKALQILNQEEEMAIIISDQRMPRMSGTEFLSLAAERFPDTIRILLTGYTDVEDLVGAINTGKVFKYVTKPWNPDELKVLVQQAAETYQILKQRTNELNRALKRESLFNAITTAIRESLDYNSMLQTIVETLCESFNADGCILHPLELSIKSASHSYQLLPESFVHTSKRCSDIAIKAESKPILSPELLTSAIEAHRIHTKQSTDSNGNSITQLIVPLIYQQDVLAVLMLYKYANLSAWSEEDIRLLEGVAEQAALAISQAKLYQQIQQQTEQMRAELAVARQIQSNLLRQQLPTLEHVKVQACCYPAREVGGDFFEVYVHPQGDIWLAVGDVSGKGVPAALFMASAISVLRRELSQEMPPAPNIIMQNLNSSLSEDLVSNNCFITMVLARYNPSTRQLVYANAGHIYPLVWSRQLIAAQLLNSSDQSCIEPIYLKVRGVPLGILPVWQAPAGEMSLKSGEVLLLASDGITEATIVHRSGDNQEKGSMLRQQGLWQLLLQEGESLNLDHLLADIQAHTPIQEDDQTILSLEVL